MSGFCHQRVSLYSSDAHSIPELYYLAAKWGRQVLGEVLEQAIKDCDITASEASAIATAILRENALALYMCRGCDRTKSTPISC